MHNQILYSMWSILHRENIWTKRDSIWTEIACGQKNHSEFLDEIRFVLGSSVWEESDRKNVQWTLSIRSTMSRTLLGYILSERNFYRKLSKIVWNAQKPDFIWKLRKYVVMPSLIMHSVPKLYFNLYKINQNAQFRIMSEIFFEFINRSMF